MSNEAQDKTPAPGVSFEQAIARIQAMLSPDAQVTHNERLVDRLGHTRQFDVVIRARIGGLPLLGVIECKDYQDKVGPEDVEAFVTKSNNLRANLKIIAARSGFTQKALEIAEHEGITAISLLKGEHEAKGFAIPQNCYARFYSWGASSCAVRFVGPKPPELTIESIVIQGQSVLEWIRWMLSTEYVESLAVGWHWIFVDFPAITNIHVNGRPYLIHGFCIKVFRALEIKRRRLNWHGDAVYNWGQGQLVVAKQGQLFASNFTLDPTVWEDFEGEIPEPEPGPLPIIELVGFSYADVAPPSIDFRTIGNVRVEVRNYRT